MGFEITSRLSVGAINSNIHITEIAITQVSVKLLMLTNLKDNLLINTQQKQP